MTSCRCNFSTPIFDNARNYGVTGLGLALSQQPRQMMGDDTTVESESLHGTTFALRLLAAVKDIAVDAVSE